MSDVASYCSPEVNKLGLALGIPEADYQEVRFRCYVQGGIPTAEVAWLRLDHTWDGKVLQQPLSLEMHAVLDSLGLSRLVELELVFRPNELVQLKIDLHCDTDFINKLTSALEIK